MLQVLYNVAVALGRVHEVQEVIWMAAAQVELGLGIEIVGLYLHDPSSGILTVNPYEGPSPIFTAELPNVRPGEAPLIEEAIAAKAAAAWPVEAFVNPAIRAGLEAEGFRVVAIIPLLSKDQVLGVALMGRRTSVPLYPWELETLEAIGTVLGVQVENATLIQELMSQRDQLRALAAGILEAREVEGRRIARNLHDIAGQLIASVRLTLEELADALLPSTQERLEAVRGQLDQVEQQLRRLSHELRPPILDDLGLEPALDFLAQGVAARTGLHITVEGSTGGRLPNQIETALYRSVQEALTNVAKHARGTRVWIELERQPEQIRCTVRDDGIGFDVPAILAQRGERGIGLLGIGERLADIRGTLELTSAPGQGTELSITVPVESNDVLPDPHRPKSSGPRA